MTQAEYERACEEEERDQQERDRWLEEWMEEERDRESSYCNDENCDECAFAAVAGEPGCRRVTR